MLDLFSCSEDAPGGESSKHWRRKSAKDQINACFFESSSSGAMPCGLGDHGPPLLSISATVNYFAAPV